METRQIELSLDTAKRLYEQGGEYRDIALTAFKEHELIGDRLPKTWEEFCEWNDITKGEFYFGGCCDIVETVGGDARDSRDDRNVLPSRKAAEAHIALMQLHQLRDAWREGWVPDWEDEFTYKYVVVISKGYYVVQRYTFTSCFLSFQDEKRANEFLTNFRELIEQAGDLI